ncbi:MAG: hypothetical protein J0L88_03160 [Xanthomonadales bacterium]|nr:hypothetical protein [Xanthomonadales bacterium]
MQPILARPLSIGAFFAFVLCLGSAPARADFIYARLVPGTGIDPNGASTAVNVSSGGRTVVFSSAANNWVANDTYNGNRVVAYDLDTGVVEVVSSVPQGGIIRGETPAVSADGRYVAFLTYASAYGTGWQVLRKDRVTGNVAVASSNAAGQAASNGTDDDTVSISADGRYVAIETGAPNFGLPTGSWPELYVKDMQTGGVKLVSAKADGSPSGGECNFFPHALSDDGRHATFQCNQPVLAGAGYGQAYVRDLLTDTTELVSRIGAGGAPSTASSNRLAISPSGRFISFQNAGYGGLGYANGSTISGNSGVYLRDRQSQQTIAIPRPAALPASDYDSCYASAVSDIGSTVLECNFNNGASTFSQVFLFVPGAGSPEMISVTGAGQPGNQPSGYTLAVNGSGLSMAWESRASNIAPGDANGVSDIFVLVDESLLDDRIFASGFDD